MRKDLAKKSGFDEEFINDCCLSRPVEVVIEEIKKENNVVSKSGGYTIIANDFKSVFNAVRSLSTIRVPHKDFSSIPMGIAIDVKEYKNDRDENLHKKEVNPAPTSLNEDLIMLYKKYEITHNSQNAMDTFVVYTREFHDELKQTERHLFSREIYFDDKTFFLGDLTVMQDTEGIISNNKINIEKFKQRIQQHKFWNYFEIKTLLFRSVESDIWKVQFLYVRLLEDATSVLDGVKTDHLMLVHQLFDIGQLNDLLAQITSGDEIRIGRITGSLGLITNKIKYDFYQRSHPFAVSFGVEYPCYALSKSGNTSTQLRAVQVRLTSELQDLNRPFEDLRDAVARSLGLGFWAGAYSPFAVVLAPLLMDIMNIEFDDGKIQVRLDCSPAVRLDGLRMSLYGRDSQDQQTSLHETITEFSRDGDSTIVYSKYYLREEDKPTVSVKLVIYYREHPMFEKNVSRSS
ncbi:MAG: hypothetical protein WAQ29_12260 [Nitrososphaeraceae archaeon]